MLSKNIKYAIAGLLVGLSLLLPVSGALACGRADNRHALAVNNRATPTHSAVASSVRQYGPITSSPQRRARPRTTSVHRVIAPPSAAAAEPLRADASTVKASVLEAAAQTVSVHQVPVHEILPSASSRAKAELASSLQSSPFCTHAAAGCGCCSANGACCGMACCAATLPASAPTLPEAHGHAWAAPPFQLSQAANTDTLFRPPCSSV
jgi:hypothetical protein